MSHEEYWTAQIEHAVRDILDPVGQDADFQDQVEAYEWLMSPDFEPGTFLFVADLLGLTERMVERLRARVYDKRPLPEHCDD